MKSIELRLEEDMVKKLALFMCALLLWVGIRARAEAFPQAPLGLYGEGDVVGFIGDSITYASYAPLSYVDMVEQYYLSIYPDQEIEFRNLSADGYKISDVLNIYDQDPAFHGIRKAVVMLGTNEAILGLSAEDYVQNMAALIGRLKGDGLDGEDILLLSPPVCDESWSGNFTQKGSLKWAFENRVLEYIGQLEEKVPEWGVRYLDLHTPMAALTRIIQQEDPGNSLTRDSIHPNTRGQWLIACLILQAQGAGLETLSDIYVPAEGEPEAAYVSAKDAPRDTHASAEDAPGNAYVSAKDSPGNTHVENKPGATGTGFTDFYRGEKGVCLTLAPPILPFPSSDSLTDFREFITHYAPSRTLFRQAFSIQGLLEDAPYYVYAGETELGTFTGKELAEGIDPGSLEAHPQQQAIGQAARLIRQRHKDMVAGRDMWIEVMMQRASFTPEEIQDAYGAWRATDDALRSEIHATLQEAAGQVLRMTVTTEGYTPEELEQDAEEAAKAAGKAAEEQAAKEAEEAAAAKKAAEEQAAREAEEAAAARKAAEEQAAREAEEAAAAKKAAEQDAKTRNILLWGGAAGAALLIGLGLCFLAIQKKKGR